MIKEPLMHMTSASSRFEQRERLHLREGEADLAGEKRRAALLVQGSCVSMKGAGGGGGAPGQTMSASRVSPLGSLPHLLYGKQCDSFKLFPFKVGAMPSFPSTRCWKDAPEGRGFLESSAGTRTPAGAHPASGPGGLPCATLRPRPATHLSAAPTRGNRSARTAGTRACPAPPAAPSSPHTGRGVRRGSTENCSTSHPRGRRAPKASSSLVPTLPARTHICWLPSSIGCFLLAPQSVACCLPRDTRQAPV